MWDLEVTIYLSTNRVRFLSFISTVTWLVGGRACFDFRARLLVLSFQLWASLGGARRRSRSA